MFLREIRGCMAKLTLWDWCLEDIIYLNEALLNYFGASNSKTSPGENINW